MWFRSGSRSTQRLTAAPYAGSLGRRHVNLGQPRWDFCRAGQERDSTPPELTCSRIFVRVCRSWLAHWVIVCLPRLCNSLVESIFQRSHQVRAKTDKMLGGQPRKISYPRNVVPAVLPDLRSTAEHDGCQSSEGGDAGQGGRTGVYQQRGVSAGRQVKRLLRFPLASGLAIFLEEAAERSAERPD